MFLLGLSVSSVNSTGIGQPPPVGSLAIIVNANNSQKISFEQAKSIFLGCCDSWDDSREMITVVLQPKNSVASAIFNQRLFADHGARLTNQWLQHVVDGTVSAPITMREQPGVLAQVRAEKSAIGYVLIHDDFEQDLTGIRIVLLLAGDNARL